MLHVQDILKMYSTKKLNTFHTVEKLLHVSVCASHKITEDHFPCPRDSLISEQSIILKKYIITVFNCKHYCKNPKLRPQLSKLHIFFNLCV